MLVNFAEEKTGECVVCYHRCGAFLMESASTTSYMVCPELLKLSYPCISSTVQLRIWFARNAVPALLCA